MKSTSKISTRARFMQILRILRKYQIRKGMDPVKFRRILEDLGPTFVKIGQIMSTRQDMFSERYCKELMKLRSRVTPMSFDTVKEQIEKSYHKPMSEVFSSFEPIPLGSASIAQVHEATLRDGTRVVAKVQRPYIYEWMERDVGLLRKAIRVLNLSDIVSSVVDLNIVIDEFWTAAKQE
ncbi:AarF/UbiB family protein, partial [Faecalicoccus sp.]